MNVGVSPFEAVAGDALRALATYDEDDLTLVYEREDIATKQRVIDDIHDDLILDDIGIGYLEDLFQVGTWHCTMHRFEDAICIHHSAGDYRGVFVSIDTNAGVDLEAVADTCGRISD